MEFFSIFYQVGFYGGDLFYHLKGWDSGLQDFVSENNQFPTIWLVTVLSALAAFAIFYYVVNHPRFNRTWHWLLVMVVLMIGMFCYSRGLVMADISGASAHPIDPSLNVAQNNATLFGVYNACLSALFFFLMSLAGRFGSKNAKNTPFKSLINKK